MPAVLSLSYLNNNIITLITHTIGRAHLFSAKNTADTSFAVTDSSKHTDSCYLSDCLKASVLLTNGDTDCYNSLYYLHYNR